MPATAARRNRAFDRRPLAIGRRRRAGGTLVTIAEPPTIQPEAGRAIFFVVDADRSQLAELARWLRDARLISNVRAVRPLAEAPVAFGPDAPRVSGKALIQVTEGW